MVGHNWFSAECGLRSAEGFGDAQPCSFSSGSGRLGKYAANLQFESGSYNWQLTSVASHLRAWGAFLYAVSPRHERRSRHTRLDIGRAGCQGIRA